MHNKRVNRKKNCVPGSVFFAFGHIFKFGEKKTFFSLSDEQLSSAKLGEISMSRIRFSSLAHNHFSVHVT